MKGGGGTSPLQFTSLGSEKLLVCCFLSLVSGVTDDEGSTPSSPEGEGPSPDRTEEGGEEWEQVGPKNKSTITRQVSTKYLFTRNTGTVGIILFSVLSKASIFLGNLWIPPSRFLKGRWFQGCGHN